MNIRSFADCLKRLDATPPSLSHNLLRKKAFQDAGEFLDSSVRAGQEHDLAKTPNAIWSLLRPRLERTVEEIDCTELDAGQVVAWQMYNDGVILKTGEITIGLDVIPMLRTRHWDLLEQLTNRLSEVLDILIVSHPHADHYDRELVRACLALGKPVLLPEPVAAEWESTSTLHAVHHDWNLNLLDLDITGREGIHVWRETPEELPLMYYEVVCQNGFTFLFGGDIDYTKILEKTPGRTIDLFFIPWRNPNEQYEDGSPNQLGTTLDAVQIATRRIEPRAILYEHCAELDHIHEGLPASYDIALNLKAALPVPSELMFWGEKLVLR